MDGNQNHQDLLDEIEDLEVCAIEGRRPRCVHRYRIKIDKERHVVPVSFMTGAQLLELAGKCDVGRWKIFQKFHTGEVQEIGHDQKVDFTTPGIEKFKTLPLDQTEGSVATLRRQFQLPNYDVEYLDSLGLPWETVNERAVKWLLIHERRLPDGYNHSNVLSAFRIEAGYPDTQIDMVYFFPHLARADGKPIGALTTQQLDGKSFQRWSRHRTRSNPWRPGVDDVSTHDMQVDHWLDRELNK